MTLFERYQALSKAQQRALHLKLAVMAEREWHAYVESEKIESYTERVVGTFQKVDWTLPADAIDVVRRGVDDKDVAARYREPIVSMQDDDLCFGRRFNFAYYSIHTLFRFYLGTETDDWLIVNQAISGIAIREELVASVLEPLLIELGA